MSEPSEPVLRRNPELPSTSASRSGGDTFSDELIVARAASAARKFFEIGTIATSFVGIAYVVGYLTAKAYFDEFHAGWLVSQISPRVLLTYSLAPMVTLVLFIYLGITDLIEGGEWREKASHLVVKWGSKAIVVWLVLEAVIRNLWRPSPAIAFIGFVLATTVAGAIVEVTVLELKNGRTKLRARMLYLSYAIVVFGLYISPTSYGRALALTDMRPQTTTLAAIELRKSESDDKIYLLLVAGDTYFCVQFPSAFGEPSRILPRSRDEIKSVASQPNRTRK